MRTSANAFLLSRLVAVMVTVPFLSARTFPFDDTEATLMSELFHRMLRIGALRG